MEILILWPVSRAYYLIIILYYQNGCILVLLLFKHLCYLSTDIVYKYKYSGKIEMRFLDKMITSRNVTHRPDVGVSSTTHISLPDLNYSLNDNYDKSIHTR